MALFTRSWLSTTLTGCPNNTAGAKCQGSARRPGDSASMNGGKPPLDIRLRRRYVEEKAASVKPLPPPSLLCLIPQSYVYKEVGIHP